MIKKITVKGAVQGVGYRPFIAEMANKYGLRGSVKNIGAAVEIMVAGEDNAVRDFADRLWTDMPPGAFILSVDLSDIPNEKEFLDSCSAFEIISSDTMDMTGEIPVFLPDIGICDDCMEEMLDPFNRRYRHALISCAVCGPRISVTEKLPYDRENTTLKEFRMCSRCRQEYSEGRRCYAQTISCNNCGPMWGFVMRYNPKFTNEFVTDSGIKFAIKIINKGHVIGFRGVSGYQLACKPTPEAAMKLRELKGREKKPFAIMYPTLDAIKEDAYVSELEEKILKSSAKPIVLLRKKKEFSVEVDNGSDYVGAFLPASGLHRLVLDETGPLIVTSCNKSDSPIIEDHSVFWHGIGEELQGYVFHNRDTCIPQDDSVLFVIDVNGKEEFQFIRRSRGYYPLPILLDNRKLNIIADKDPETVLAMGGDLKSCPAIACGDKIMPTQHIGDLANEETFALYRRMIDEFTEKFMQVPTVIVSDLHPGYQSTAYGNSLAETCKLPVVQLQHHFAHTYSVMAEGSLENALGVSFDGTGYGLDGNVWGSEFIHCEGTEPKRMGHLSYVKLVGQDAASKDAYMVSRCYLNACREQGLLTEEVINDITGGDEPSKLTLINSAYRSNVNTCLTSSMGRLFDAVAAILGIAAYNDYEGECAVKLEQAASRYADSETEEKRFPAFAFELKMEDDGSFTFDQASLFAQIVICYNLKEYSVESIAYGFHMAVVDLILQGCNKMKEMTGESAVCLSGGVFNNRFILKQAIRHLTKQGFIVYWNQEVPLGDGGLSLGQAYYGLLLNRK